MNKTTITSNETWVTTIEKMVLEELREPLSEIELAPKNLPAKKIAGFTVEDTRTIVETSVNLQAKNLNKQAEKFQADSSAFRLALESQGIKAIGIIPSGVWEAICKKFALYRFEHLSAGSTHASPSAVSRISEISDSFRFGMLSSACIAAIVWLGYIVNPFLGWSHPERHELIYALALISAFPLSFLIISLTQNLGAALTFMIPSFITMMAAMINYFEFSLIAGLILIIIGMIIIFMAMGDEISQRDLKLVGKRRLLRLLFPDNIDCKKSQDRQELKITPIFPTPDKAFRELLITLENNENRLCVAAEAGAIKIALPQLSESIREYLAKRDPILYIKSTDGKLIAILGQFGHFKNEKKAIKMVKSMRIRDVL